MGSLAGSFFRLIGEPQISHWTPDEMAAELRKVGLVVHEDSGMTGWNQRFARDEAKVAAAGYMRVVAARALHSGAARFI